MRIFMDKKGRIALSDFSAAQAYKIAAKMEKNGIQFYTDLLEEVKDKEVRAEVDFLIAQELEHLKTFEGLLQKQTEIDGDSFEEDDIVSYLDSHVFNVSHLEHRHTAFEEAMNMERRSIVFYEASLAEAQEGPAQKAFGKILEEEKKHLASFANLLRLKCFQSKKGCIL